MLNAHRDEIAHLHMDHKAEMEKHVGGFLPGSTGAQGKDRGTATRVSSSSSLYGKL